MPKSIPLRQGSFLGPLTNAGRKLPTPTTQNDIKVIIEESDFQVFFTHLIIRYLEVY